MTFSTEKNKIFKIWNDSIENQFQITALADNDKIILSKTNNLNRVSTIYNNIITLSSDWLIPNTILTTYQGEEVIRRMYKEYQVEINGLNEQLIPYIETKLSYRLGSGKISIPIPKAPQEPTEDFDEYIAGEEDMHINDVVKVGDSANAGLKNIVYSSSFYLNNDQGLPPELEIKFFITLFNPIYYQST